MIKDKIIYFIYHIWNNYCNFIVMGLDHKPKGEILSHQFSMRVVKGDTEFNEEEFAKRIAKYIVGFLECYPHYIIKEPFKDDQETWIFRFWIDKL